MILLNGIAKCHASGVVLSVHLQATIAPFAVGFTKKPNSFGESFSGASYRSQAG